MATSSRLMPLAYLLSVMRDPAQPMALRMRAAIAALPYTAPKKRASSKDGLTAASNTSAARVLPGKPNRRLALVKKP